MIPILKEGNTVMVNRLAYFFNQPKVNDIVIIRRVKDKKYIIKRIAKMRGQKYFLLGDNKKKSSDSRNFGWILRKEIVGKVIL